MSHFSPSASHCRAARLAHFETVAVAAGIVGDARVRAVHTALDVSARLRRFDGISIADMTFSWPRLTWPGLASRHAAPWARKTSATSRRGRAIRRGRAGGDRLAMLRPSCSQGAFDVADPCCDGDAGTSRCVAKLCRNVCVDTRLEIPARFLAACTARLSRRADIELTGFWPGNSQACGRAGRHHSRNSSSSLPLV